MDPFICCSRVVFKVLNIDDGADIFARGSRHGAADGDRSSDDEYKSLDDVRGRITDDWDTSSGTPSVEVEPNHPDYIDGGGEPVAGGMPDDPALLNSYGEEFEELPMDPAVSIEVLEDIENSYPIAIDTNIQAEENVLSDAGPEDDGPNRDYSGFTMKKDCYDPYTLESIDDCEESGYSYYHDGLDMEPEPVSLLNNSDHGNNGLADIGRDRDFFDWDYEVDSEMLLAEEFGTPYEIYNLPSTQYRKQPMSEVKGRPTPAPPLKYRDTALDCLQDYKEPPAPFRIPKYRDTTLEYLQDYKNPPAPLPKYREWEESPANFEDEIDGSVDEDQDESESEFETEPTQTAEDLDPRYGWKMLTREVAAIAKAKYNY